MRARWIALALVFAAACGEDGAAERPDGGVDAPGAADAACSQNPTTHAEIVNACTTAQNVIKQPNLPLLNADGTLPPRLWYIRGAMPGRRSPE